MEKSLIERMIEAKENKGIALISFFNSGEVRKDEFSSTVWLKWANDKDAFKTIANSMFDMTESYARDYDFDSVNMELELGLIYSSDQFNEDKSLKEDAKPMDEIVRYYTGKMDCSLDGEKTNERDYGKWHGRQGFIGYNTLLESIRKNGLSFDGPKSFNEFKEKIQNGEQFPINISASLLPKEEIEQVKEKPKSKIKRFLNL